MASSTPRSIEKTWQSVPTIEGAGVQLRRALGFPHLPRFDPFLLLDDFRADDPKSYEQGFPWHPHRGMETITYVLDGDVEHQDSLGNAGVIGSGDVQWMTAGSGIVHQEMPRGDRRGRVAGFQLWANLPASHKMMDPRYREVKSAAIPVATAPGGARIRVIAGEALGTAGPVKDVVTEPRYLDVELPAGASLTLPVAHGHTLFAYVIEGEGFFDGGRDGGARDVDVSRPRRCGDGTLVLYGPEGDAVTVTTEARPVRFLLVSGRPLGEPIAWYGPIVMNTREELRSAFSEFEAGTFLKHRG